MTFSVLANGLSLPDRFSAVVVLGLKFTGGHFVFTLQREKTTWGPSSLPFF